MSILYQLIQYWQLLRTGIEFIIRIKGGISILYGFRKNDPLGVILFGGLFYLKKNLHKWSYFLSCFCSCGSFRNKSGNPWFFKSGMRANIFLILYIICYMLFSNRVGHIRIKACFREQTLHCKLALWSRNQIPDGMHDSLIINLKRVLNLWKKL